jgi:hypothetical protein
MNTMKRTLVSFAVLLAACGDGDPEYTCQEPPNGLTVPMLRTRDGNVAHWPLKPGCLPVTFDPGLAERVADIQAALDAWDAVACSSLCFQPPKSQVVPDSSFTERRLHFVLEPLPMVPPGASSESTLGIRSVDGAILSGRITMRETTFTRGDLVNLVGRALGLQPPAAGVDSAIVPKSQRLEPSASDTQTLCALYGKPALCGE